MGKPKLIAPAVVAILFVVVLLQNRDQVVLQFLFWAFPVSMLVLILVTGLAGFAAGFLAARWLGRSRAGEKPG